MVPSVIVMLPPFFPCGMYVWNASMVSRHSQKTGASAGDCVALRWLSIFRKQTVESLLKAYCALDSETLLAGDCCTATCTTSASDNCPNNDSQCVDPIHAATPAPTMPALWPDCNLNGHPLTWLNDSYCDSDLNNEDCAYDGGASGSLRRSSLFIIHKICMISSVVGCSGDVFAPRLVSIRTAQPR